MQGTAKGPRTLMAFYKSGLKVLRRITNKIVKLHYELVLPDRWHCCQTTQAPLLQVSCIFIFNRPT